MLDKFDDILDFSMVAKHQRREWKLSPRRVAFPAAISDLKPFRENKDHVFSVMLFTFLARLALKGVASLLCMIGCMHLGVYLHVQGTGLAYMTLPRMLRYIIQLEIKRIPSNVIEIYFKSIHFTFNYI